jgi:hypothetical protein
MESSVEARAALVTSVMWTPGWLISNWIAGSDTAPLLMGVTPRIFRSMSRPERSYLGVGFWLLPGKGTRGPRGRRTWLATLYSDDPESADELRVISIHFSLDGFLDVWPVTSIDDAFSDALTDEERSLLVTRAARL